MFAALCILYAGASAEAAVAFGQLDDFQDGTVMGWVEGVASPNPPENAVAGGPGGDADRYLRNVSAGGVSAGGRMVMFNGEQWAGNYNAAGVTRIDAWMANFGPSPLHMRLAVMAGTSVYGSSAAVELPADSTWRRVSFDLTRGALEKVEGTDTLTEALSHVAALRILSAEGGATHMGDGVAATLGVDDIRALRLPGDANFDGRVDAADYRIARLNLGSAGGRSWAQGDFDFDGRVGARDLLLLRRNLGMSIPSAAATAFAPTALAPEPGGLALLLLACPALLHRRRNHSVPR